MRTRHLMTLLFITAAFLAFTSQSCVAASASTSQEEAAFALTNAEKAVASAYNATVHAQQVGVDTSSLMVMLNNATVELSTAENAFRESDFNSTLASAENSSQIANTVKAEAEQLQLDASGRQLWAFWSRIGVSIAAVAGVGLGSFLAWRSFKKRYYQRLLKMKPEEAVSNES